MIADVVIDAGTRHLTGTFSYRVPPQLERQIEPGHRVYVPFGRQFCQAFVLALREDDTEVEARPLKSIASLLDVEPLLTEPLRKLAKYMEYRTAAAPIEVIKSMLPSAFAVSTKRLYEAVPEADVADAHLTDVLSALRAKLSLPDLIRRCGPDASLALERLLALGAAREVASAVEKAPPKLQAVLVPVVSPEQLQHVQSQRQSRAPKQAAILSMLLAGEVVLPDHQLVPSDTAVTALVRDGLAKIEQRPLAAQRYQGGLRESYPQALELTSAQARAVRAIDAARTERRSVQFVLHGVTGSGKTEVYLQAIHSVRNDGAGAIVLVPEIVLTPQMVGRFTSRFGDTVAVLHSGLSQRERKDEWLRVRRGEASIVIGARSAVFAPVHNLGLMIIDEEHESSYKQEDSPFYDARDLARFRAETEAAVVVRGSATPSLEAMHLVSSGKAELLSLPTRVHAQPLPPVEVVDMREELRSGNHDIFSRALLAGLEETIAQGKQAILFLNRRGYASFMLCRACGHVPECPHCDISLTLHQTRRGARYLACHYCHYREPAQTMCSACLDGTLRPFGIGTEQVESHIETNFPNWRVLRMDVDTTRKKGSHQQVLQAFGDGEADILLGTQMIAKGLDFPNVAFVGVIAADTMLSVPDYRSAERTFGLLTQVAGRAGRSDTPGRTVIQTFRADHYAVQAAAHHDFGQFYRQEDEIRRLFAYPPYCELAVLRAVHTEERYAKGAAERFERELKRSLPPTETTILPAAPAGIGRIENRFRYQVVVKYSRWEQVEQAVSSAYQVVLEKMHKLGGSCTLDVKAARI